MMGIQVQKRATLRGHTDAVFVLERSPEASHCFSAGGDGMIVDWDLNEAANGKMLAKVDASVYALRYEPRRNWLLVGQNFEGVHAIDLSTREVVMSSKLTTSAIFDIQVFGERAYIACGDGELIVLELEKFTTLARLRASTESARCIAIHPEGDQWAVGFSDHHIRVLGIDDNKLQAEWKAHENSVFTLVYTPDGGRLLSGSRDAHLKSWRTDSNQLDQSVAAHMYALNHLTFSPDGRHLATASMDKSVKVWRTSDLKLLKVLDKARHAGHGTSVNRVLWDVASGWLVSASDDRTLSLWDIAFE